MVASLDRKLCKPVQPTPLEPPPKPFIPPVEELGVSAPLFNASSNMAASFPAVYPNNYGYDDESGRYGNPGTRFNSSQVDDTEHNARAEYRYQQGVRRPMPAPGWTDPYSAPYSDPNAYSQGYNASYEAPQRENQVPPALEHILNRFLGPASVVSQARLVDFLYFVEIIKIHSCLPCISFPWSPPLGLYSLESCWAAAGFPRPVPNHASGLVPVARYSNAKMCGSKHGLVFA
jgi:hypothetical protein